MKKYIGTPGNGGDSVFVWDGEHQHKLRNCPIGRQQSPTGFAWGYGGSGPSALAASILWDALGDKVKCRYCTAKGFSRSRCWRCSRTGVKQGFWEMFQDFKWETVATWPGDKGWSMTEGEVMLWWQRWISQGHKLEDWPRE